MKEKIKEITLERLVNERGGIIAPILIATAATPICGYIGSYLGEALGYVWGNFLDFIPYVRDIAPWLAERSGLINDSKPVIDLNENLYQTTGAIGGFYGGLTIPWTILIGYYSSE